MFVGLFAIMIGSGSGDAKPFQENCSGYLIQDPEFGLHLAKNAKGDAFDGVTWCDASIEDKLKDVVLQKCSVGRPCKIRGYVEGHGTFHWTS